MELTLYNEDIAALHDLALAKSDYLIHHVTQECDIQAATDYWNLAHKLSCRLAQNLHTQKEPSKCFD